MQLYEPAVLMQIWEQSLNGMHSFKSEEKIVNQLLTKFHPEEERIVPNGKHLVFVAAVLAAVTLCSQAIEGLFGPEFLLYFEVFRRVFTKRIRY